MHSQIEPLDPARNTGVTVNVGGARLTLREFQDLYAELGNGGDNLSQRFKLPFVVQIDDLKALYQKLTHLISNFQPVATKEKISITHFEDDTQEFDSFEKFLGYDKNKGSPITSINVEISFAVKSPLSPQSKIREYEIDLFLVSTMAEAKKFSVASEEGGGLPFMRIPFSAAVRVQYFDYSIAVACMSVVVAWIKALRQNQELRCYRWLKKTRLVSDFVVHFLVLASICGAVGAALVSYFSVESVSLVMMLGFMLAVGLTSHRLGFWMTEKLKASLALLAAHSVIELGTGDQRLKEWYESERNKSFFNQIFTIGGALVTSLVVGLTVRFLLPK